MDVVGRFLYHHKKKALMFKHESPFFESGSHVSNKIKKVALVFSYFVVEMDVVDVFDATKEVS